MTQLIVRMGMTKSAAEEDGPSFEQQFGILANAVVTEKFPQLDKNKLAFQLIEKNDENSEAVGVMAYLMGKNVIFVPAFFKSQKLRTGDMMFLAKQQQFLPLSDPWLAWVRDKDVQEAGESVPGNSEEAADADSTRVREYMDPITKTACMRLKAILHSPVELEKDGADASLLDTALQLGKQASEALCDNLIKSTDFLNATLAFYSGDELDTFAKKAYAMAEEKPDVELVMPFTKEAAALSMEDQVLLQRDGYFIKWAARDTPDVITKPQISNMFGNINRPGKVQLLNMDGSLSEAVVLRYVDTSANKLCLREIGEDSAGDPGETAASYMLRGNAFMSVSDKGICELPPGTMVLLSSYEDFKPSMIEGKGSAIKTADTIGYNTWLMYPDGTCGRWTGVDLCKTGPGRWAASSLHNLVTIAVLSESDELTGPIELEGYLVLPRKTRFIKVEWKGEKQTGTDLPCVPVTMDTFDAFITEFCKKHYTKARVYSNGSDIEIGGDKTASVVSAGRGEAAYRLVKDYGVSPEIAGEMIKGASVGASYDSPKSTTYFITKTASDPMWQDANIPMGEYQNKPEQTDYKAMPTMLESPEQLEKAVQSASQNGIKEVFDVTALKLLVRQSKFFDEISEDMPLFMRTLDSLCRKLFQFYWHTDKMEEKYGMVKLKALEDSLKTTIDALSELTIFFKLRTVDGSGSTGDTLGDLMSGQML